MFVQTSRRTKQISRRTKQRGFSLVELAIALFVFAMMTLIFAAAFPIATRGAHVGANYAQATLLAQHKIDQARAAGFDRLDWTNLTTLKIVDTATAPVANPAGFPAGSTQYSFTDVDDLVDDAQGDKGYFPAGSTGTMTVGPISGAGWTVPAAAKAKQITVTISWSGAGQSQGSFTTQTVIANL